MTFNHEEFEKEKSAFLLQQNHDEALQANAFDFVAKADKHRYEYQWTWMGMPIIKMPEDIILIQQIIYATKPDYIIETGIAWGGSVVYYASLLQLLGKGEIIAIDTILPKKNIDKIMAYSFSSRIHLLEGSSIDVTIFEKVKALIKPNTKVMVILGNHTHEHVYNELNLYSSLVSSGQYIIVEDTVLEHIPQQVHRQRPWGSGNNPYTAVKQFLLENKNFSNDNKYNKICLISCNKGGYIVRA
ncbi:MAG: cephalosporin hydroxylase family protein [Puniceicoccales bacterium]|nr:cephalosporin hydroxylase family protein [Puniceicoccales bacterium]